MPPPVRRLALALVALAGLLLAGLVLPGSPAAGQSSPSISINPTSAPAGSSGTWSIVVSGQDWRAGRQLSIEFAADPARFFTPTSTSFAFTITPARRIAGTYAVTVTQDLCDFDSCPVERTVVFTATVGLALEPPCSTPGASQNLVVRGSGWNPQFQVTVTYDYPSNNAQTFTPAGNGDFARTFTVTPPNRDVVVFADQPRMQFTSRLVWSPCPPGPTTTSTSTSTSTTTTSTTEPGEEPTTTTTEAPNTTTTRPGLPGPDVTVPPTVPLPPPTPGATLTVSPPLGPTGFVTAVTGTGFPPNVAVEIHWQPGVGQTMATTGADGTFRAQALVFPKDQIGPRALIATSGATTAYTAFLVVASTVQPSGQNVAQITRIRRFLQR